MILFLWNLHYCILNRNYTDNQTVLLQSPLLIEFLMLIKTKFLVFVYRVRMADEFLSFGRF